MIGETTERERIYGTDWKFPLQPDGQGRLARVSEIENINQAIFTWIKTRQGERLYCRKKGIGGRRWIHMSAEDVIRKAPREIETGLLRWESRIKSVTVLATKGNLTVSGERVVSLNIKYVPIGYGLQQSLVVPVVTAGASS